MIFEYPYLEWRGCRLIGKYCRNCAYQVPLCDAYWSLWASLSNSLGETALTGSHRPHNLTIAIHKSVAVSMYSAEIGLALGKAPTSLKDEDISRISGKTRAAGM